MGVRLPYARIVATTQNGITFNENTRLLLGAIKLTGALTFGPDCEIHQPAEGHFGWKDLISNFVVKG